MEEFNQNQKNYWPHGIILSIILIIIASAWTVVIALDNPVEMDSYYLEKYQDVDKNINQIIKKQKAFFNKYEVKFDLNKITLDKPTNIGLWLIEKQTNQNIQDANITILLTRPETNKYNQELTKQHAENGKFTFNDITVKQPGRWQFKAKIKKGDFEGFYEYEINATK